VTHNKPGATQFTVDQMARMGVFQGKINDVCEIGPGSGRYLEKVLRACTPARFEVYETAGSWANYLADNYDVILRPTDGKTLSATASDSIDLVQAHKVFSITPFMTTCGYLAEMARVVKPGGFVVFDMITECCLDDDTLERWMLSGIGHCSYPAPIPREIVLRFFQKRGVSIAGSFKVPLGPGTTECMIFVKRPAANGKLHTADPS